MLCCRNCLDHDKFLRLQTVLDRTSENVSPGFLGSPINNTWVILTWQRAWRRVRRAGHRLWSVVPEAVCVVREAGCLRDRRAPLIAADVRQWLVPSWGSVRVVPARLWEALMAAPVRVRLVLAAASWPERQRRLALSLHGQVVIGGRCGILVLEGARRVGRVAPGLLRVPNDARLGVVPLGRDVQRLRRVGTDAGRRGAGRGGWRGGGCGRRRAAWRRRVRLLVQRAADPVHHGPPGRAGGVAGGGRWRRGSRVAGCAEAPDMVVRVQGGGRASHGGSGESRPVHARRGHIAPRYHASHTPQRHMKIKTRARFRAGRTGADRGGNLQESSTSRMKILKPEQVRRTVTDMIR